MSNQHIHSTDVNIKDLFKEFYSVPPYQREYVWKAENVDQLLKDIENSMPENDQEHDSEYFIGTIVVCKNSESVLELIDGQQRMTTIFIILCAIRDCLKRLNDESQAISYQIKDMSVDSAGSERSRYRLTLLYEDSGDILSYIAEGNILQEYGGSRSTKNLAKAYEVATDFLKQFDNDIKRVRGFYGHLIDNVKLIKIETKNVTKALGIFETINDRGVGLDPMDLLKNLLFMRSKADQFALLNNKWKELQDIIFDINEKPLRFLRYFLLSQYDARYKGSLIREGDIYPWLLEKKSEVKYGDSPIEFVETLIEAAQAYRNFYSCTVEHSETNKYLENIRTLGGKSMRLHLILLLAGRHLSKTQFAELCHESEKLFFCFLVSREPAKDQERTISQWVKDLRNVNNQEQFDKFISQTFTKTKESLSRNFNDAFIRLSEQSIQQYRLRYILAKITQYIDINAYGINENTQWLKKYTQGDFDIEHIYPQEPSNEAINEFGVSREDDDVMRQMVGNLVLLEKSLNASAGNKAYSKKKEYYCESNLLFTRSLCIRPKSGEDTKIIRAVSEIETYPVWNKDAISIRQKSLLKFALKVWDIPSI